MFWRSFGNPTICFATTIGNKMSCKNKMFAWVTIYVKKLYNSVASYVCPPKPAEQKLMELDARETIHDRLLVLDDVAGYVKRKREKLANAKRIKNS